MACPYGRSIDHLCLGIEPVPVHIEHLAVGSTGTGSHCPGNIYTVLIQHSEAGLLANSGFIGQVFPMLSPVIGNQNVAGLQGKRIDRITVRIGNPQRNLVDGRGFRLVKIGNVIAVDLYPCAFACVIFHIHGIGRRSNVFRLRRHTHRTAVSRYAPEAREETAV